MCMAYRCHRPECITARLCHWRLGFRFGLSKMAMARIRNDSWKEDLELREDMTKYVSRGLKRKEILDFLQRDYPLCAWSFRSLDRRLREFHKLYGWPVTEDELEDVAQHSGVLDTESDFLDPDLRKACEEIIPSPEEVEPKDVMDAYLYLQSRFPVALLNN